VWSRVQHLAGLPIFAPSIDAILLDIAPFAKTRTCKSTKLVVAAAAYFIWQERNGRLFKESKCSVVQSVSTRMNKITGKREGGVAQTRMPIRGPLNPNIATADHVDFANQKKVHNASSNAGNKQSGFMNYSGPINLAMNVTLTRTSVRVGTSVDDSAPEGDRVRASSLAGKISLSHKSDHKNETGTFTSYGELLKPTTVNHSISLDRNTSEPKSTQSEIDDFLKELEVGKIQLWLDQTLDIRSGIIEIIDENGKLFWNCKRKLPLLITTSLVSTRLEHTLYGYFIGKRMAFPVVEYYAKNNWLKRIMMNSKGFFFFKFDSKAGLEAVLEGSPWLIRKSLSILKKWSAGTRLLKEEFTRIPIWVKLHDVPLQVFDEDGISLIATFIGKHVMLDSYISFMCKDSWGSGSFARCLIKVNSKADLVDDQCPKKMACPPIVSTLNVVTLTVEKSNDGFQMVGKKKRRKGKSKSTNDGQFVGPSVKQNVRYVPKAATSVPKKGTTNVGNASNSSSMLKSTGNSSNNDNITSSNSFSTLNVEEEEEEEVVENVYDETDNLCLNTKTD
nr:hypothetical protein [Tanacetum cinerariifolium]